jgi:hypothetical protein
MTFIIFTSAVCVLFVYKWVLVADTFRSNYWMQLQKHLILALVTVDRFLAVILRVLHHNALLLLERLGTLHKRYGLSLWQIRGKKKLVKLQPLIVFLFFLYFDDV